MMSQNDVGNVPFSWLPAYGEAVEQALNASRNILETILEETSDDEEDSEIWNNSGDWATSNSDSVTNSVIEVDLNQDTETLSERDFICPAKRRRQDTDGSVETNFVLRRPTSDGDRYRVLEANSLLEVPDFLPAKRNEQLRYRFDELGLAPDMYSDSDSLPYDSLSRSSSLIQFESLERQLLQNDAGPTSSAENPKPITGLSDFERMLCRKNTTNLLQNLKIPVPKVNVSEVRDAEDEVSDDSESSGVDESTNSSFSSEESYYLNHSSDKISEDEAEIIKIGNRSVAKGGCVNDNSFSRRFSSNCSGNNDATNTAHGSVNRIASSNGSSNNVRNKNSVESLSEDSGFCDQSITNSLRRVKSKSNPSLNVLENGHFSQHAMSGDSHVVLDDDICCKSMEDLSAMETKSLGGTTKTTTTRRRTESKNSSDVSERQRQTTTTQRKITIADSQQEKISRQKRVKSSSSPELRCQATQKKNSVRETAENTSSEDLFHVSSVPGDLNLCGDPGSIAAHASKEVSCDSIATHNVNLFTLNSPTISNSPSVIPINPSLTASYANLTLLNYSDTNMAGNGSASDLFGNRKYATGGPDTTKSEFTTLLEEITAHFDRNLSILNDQQETYEPSVRTIYEEPCTMEARPVPLARPKRQPPLPPPRKSSKNKILSPILTSSVTSQMSQLLQSTRMDDQPSKNTTQRDECDASSSYTAALLHPPSYTEYLSTKNNSNSNPFVTFDQDPTNLRTTYTESLEQCNFDSAECSAVDLTTIRKNMVSPSFGMKGKDLHHQKTIHGRVLVQSTPNLNENRQKYKIYDIDDSLEHHNSLKDVTMSTFMGPRQGILTQSGENTAETNAGSKSGLSKGVSFCPIVSEISWKDTNVSDDSLSGASSNSSNGVPAYPKYNVDEEDDDMDDDELIALENYRTNQAFDDEEDDSAVQGTKSWINEDEMIGKTSCGDFGEYLLPIYGSVSAPSTSSNSNFTTTFVTIDNQHNDKDAIRHRSVMHIPIVNNNPVVDPVADRACGEFVPEREANNDALTTSIHKAPATECRSSVKMYANEKRSAAVDVVDKSHNLASNNKNIKNNQMNNQKINKATYLDAVSSVNNNGTEIASSNKNNNHILNNKFEVTKKSKKDGFLSRISSGLRFSFRGKKSPKAGAVYNYNQFEADQRQADLANKKNAKVTKNNQEIVFIPLKDPTQENVQSFIQHEIAAQATSADNNNHMLHGNNKKPPVPSKPPRPFVAGRPPIHPKSAHAHRAGSLSPPPRDTAVDVTHSQHAYHDFVPANQLRAATLSGNTAKYRDDDDYNMGSEQKIGLIETNLDTHETVITGKTQSLMELGGPGSYMKKGHTLGGPVSRAIISSKANKTIIGNSHHHHNNTLDVDSADCAANNGRPHKSMEFLLDKDNHQQVLPPENELQKSHETNTNLSEHQLRVQASLQRLNVPDWYKSYTSGNNTTIGASPANRSTLDSSGFLRKRNSDVGRWTGLSSKTTSLSSLGSQRSDRSPVMLSPSSHSHHGQTGFSRWSTSHLNSNQTSPSVSTRGSFSRGVLSAGGYQSTGNTLRGSYRQPYLGWRSQEKLAAQQQQQQQQASTLRTPAERLASSLLQQKQQQQQRDSDSKPPIPPHHQHHYQQQSASPVIGTPEIKDEIKEVTSAIVHYVNDQRNSRSRSTSPSQRCWLESSFVGTKPLESPQTPVIDNATTTNVVAAFQSSSLPRHTTSSRNNGAALNGNGESTYV
ncbi:putative mediator of RNA polymerase II transcription subunit 26 [Culicoides brevitarsis]|uniref:putative mediator of RNA polymerase II transcription subunit 26 n=1 Tax=Culicoides brevitarsis TaxID=469753 RepID=UPI00307C37BE